MNRKNLSITLLFMVVSLTAGCGGGSSNNGGGGGGGESSTPMILFTTGSYSGIQNLVFSASGFPSNTDRTSFAMTVTTNRVTIFDAGFNASGAISPDGNFTVQVPNTSLGSDDELPCEAFLTLTYTGRVLGSNTNGTITGRATCAGLPNITISGSFAATIGTAKQSLYGIQDAVTNLLKQQ